MLLTYYEYILRQFCHKRWDDIVNEANCVAKQSTIFAKPLFAQYGCKGLAMGGDVKNKGHSPSHSSIDGCHGSKHDGSWGVERHHI